MLSRTFDDVAKNAMGVALLTLLCAVCGGEARCQTPSQSDPNPKEMHGGIEIALRTVRAIVLRASISAEGDNIKIVSSDQLTPPTPLARDDKPSPEYIRDLAQTVQKISEKLQRDFRIPPNQIHLLGLSELVGQVRDDLAREVLVKTGKEITFLDPTSETELSVAGSIPRRYQQEGKWYDNRNISLMLEIGPTKIRGGYQQLKQTSRGRTEYDYATWEIPIGAGLRAKLTQNDGIYAGPYAGLMTRKKYYLTGDIVWALVTLLRPEDQRGYMPLTIEDINNFHYRAMNDPEALLNPDLSKITDQNTRNEARKGREAVKALYTPKALAAGAEAMKLVATELNLVEKQLIFARNGNLARLLSYVRLQID
jgi:hypothetical protein